MRAPSVDPQLSLLNTNDFRVFTSNLSKNYSSSKYSKNCSQCIIGKDHWHKCANGPAEHLQNQTTCGFGQRDHFLRLSNGICIVQFAKLHKQTTCPTVCAVAQMVGLSRNWPVHQPQAAKFSSLSTSDNANASISKFTAGIRFRHF